MSSAKTKKKTKKYTCSRQDLLLDYEDLHEQITSLMKNVLDGDITANELSRRLEELEERIEAYNSNLVHTMQLKLFHF